MLDVVILEPIVCLIVDIVDLNAWLEILLLLMLIPSLSLVLPIARILILKPAVLLVELIV